MSESDVQLQPESTGPKIRTELQTVSGSSVHAQVVAIGDPATTANLAGITAGGALQVDGSATTQPVSGSVSASISAGTVNVNAATITSMPSVTVSAGTMSNLTVVAMNAGTVTSATITAALPAGTNVIGGLKIYDPGGNTAAVVTASSALKVDGSASTQPVSGTVTVSAATVSDGGNSLTVDQGAGSTVNPWAQNLIQVGGTTVAAVAKGTQAGNAVGVQDLKDSGRTPITFNCDQTAGSASEALLTMTINKNGTTSSASTYAITSGKTLRIQGAFLAVKATSTTTVAARARLRWANSTATPTTATSILFGLECSSLAALANSTGVDDTDIPDGIELPGGTNIGFSQIASATSSTLSLNVIAFEY